VFAGTVQTAGARFISKYNAEGKVDDISTFLYKLLKKAAMLGVFGFVIFYLISPGVAKFLKIESTTEVVVLGTVLIFSFLLPATSGALQGLQQFNSLALVNVLTFAPKLLFGVLLVSLGYGVSGALGAVALAMMVAFLFSLVPLRIHLRNGRNGNGHDFKEFYLYSAPTVLVMMSLAVPANLDVILAKHFFTGYEAGLYTAVSVLGKIVLFFSGAISVVMLPKASEMRTLRKSTRPILNKSLMYTGLLSGTAAAIFILAPGLIGTIFGSVYMEASPVIKIYMVMMFLFSLTWVVAQYCLATNDLRYAYLLVSFTVIEVALVSIIHDSIFQMVVVLMGANLILFIASYGNVLRRREYEGAIDSDTGVQ